MWSCLNSNFWVEFPDSPVLQKFLASFPAFRFKSNMFCMGRLHILYYGEHKLLSSIQDSSSCLRFLWFPSGYPTVSTELILVTFTLWYCTSIWSLLHTPVSMMFCFTFCIYEVIADTRLGCHLHLFVHLWYLVSWSLTRLLFWSLLFLIASSAGVQRFTGSVSTEVDCIRNTTHNY